MISHKTFYMEKIVIVFNPSVLWALSRDIHLISAQVSALCSAPTAISMPFHYTTLFKSSVKYA